MHQLDETELRTVNRFEKYRLPILSTTVPLILILGFYGSSIFRLITSSIGAEQGVIEIQWLQSAIHLINTLLEAFSIVLSSFTSPWLWAGLIVLAIMSACSCAGIGTLIISLSNSSYFRKISIL